ncbi:unnamed protein product [Heterobilharzia americana]|nr:unnamed protein product [Heterobilharzia americana]
MTLYTCIRTAEKAILNSRVKYNEGKSSQMMSLEIYSNFSEKFVIHAKSPSFLPHCAGQTIFGEAECNSIKALYITYEVVCQGHSLDL